MCDSSSKLYSEELKIQLESQELETEEAIVITTKQEPSELKRAKYWQGRRKENTDERKSDENHVGEAAGQSLELEQAIKTRLVDIFQLWFFLFADTICFAFSHFHIIHDKRENVMFGKPKEVF